MYEGQRSHNDSGGATTHVSLDHSNQLLKKRLHTLILCAWIAWEGRIQHAAIRVVRGLNIESNVWLNEKLPWDAQNSIFVETDLTMAADRCDWITVWQHLTGWRHRLVHWAKLSNGTWWLVWRFLPLLYKIRFFEEMKLTWPNWFQPFVVQ